MTTNYDPIAEQYKRSKQQPWRTFIECFTLMELIGDPRGLAVLDLACGQGFYSRLIRQRGAARVKGIDLSPGMIELASMRPHSEAMCSGVSFTSSFALISAPALSAFLASSTLPLSAAANSFWGAERLVFRGLAPTAKLRRPCRGW